MLILNAGGLQIRPSGEIKAIDDIWKDYIEFSKGK